MKTEFYTFMGTLESGYDTLGFVNDYINENSIIEVYTDNYDAYPKEINVTGNNLTIKFDKYLSDVHVKVVVNNIPNNTGLDIPTKIDEMTDVEIVAVSSGAILVFDSETQIFKTKLISTNDLDDVTTNEIQTGDVFIFNGNKWTNSPLNLTNISDTNITNPQNNDVLTYDNGVWKNKPSSGGNSYIYSTDEQLVGKWVDGKKIYQKSYVREGAITTSGVTLDTINDFYELIDVKLTATGSSRNSWFLPISSSSSNTLRIDILTNGTVRLVGDTSWSNPKINCTIYYTKVGD